MLLLRHIMSSVPNRVSRPPNLRPENHLERCGQNRGAGRTRWAVPDDACRAWATLGPVAVPPHVVEFVSAAGFAERGRMRSCLGRLRFLCTGTLENEMPNAIHDSAASPYLGHPPLIVQLRPVLELTDDQLFDFSQINRDLRIERNAQGEANRGRIPREKRGSLLSATRIPTHFRAIPPQWTPI